VKHTHTSIAKPTSASIFGRHTSDRMVLTNQSDQRQSGLSSQCLETASTTCMHQNGTF
jgi:hypothetical protein